MLGKRFETKHFRKIGGGMCVVHAINEIRATILDRTALNDDSTLNCISGTMVLGWMYENY